MTKNYFYIFTIFLILSSTGLYAQQSKQQEISTPIEGFNMYPNPVTNGKVYITTKNDSEKSIIVFDVLGKKIIETLMSSRELNISNLSPGVYIIKVNEENASTTRKLIVR
jgi:hypothetical protein